MLTWPETDDPPLTQAEPQSTPSGPKIYSHQNNVHTQVLDHTPTLADASVDLTMAAAVPVVQSTRNGQVLTLVVRHHATCEPAEVLLADTGSTIDILVLFTAPRDDVTCRLEASNVWAVHSALDVALPATLTAATVKDVG